MTAPRISLVIPAYNESALLPRLLDSVDAARERFCDGAGCIEVIVADNASTDSTAEIAMQRGCRVAMVEKRAIAAARNGGAAVARGDYLAFIDADSRIHPETFNAIHKTLTASRVVVGATGVVPERWSVGIFLTWAIMTPLVWLMRMDAGVVFCRRADFETVGGYDETLLYAEDVKFLHEMKRWGKAHGKGFARPAGVKAITSARKFDKHGDWHFLIEMPLAGWRVLYNKEHGKAFARKYWYDDR